ncbi:MAG: isochorismatase family protein [Planctomycetota bacterium]
MIRQLFKTRRKRILIDISTQKDLFLASGKACIGNHRRVLGNIRRVMAWARHNSISVISTCEIYPKNGNGNGNGNGNIDDHYCIDGTDGQQKIRYTLLNNRATFPADGNTNLPLDVLRAHRQVVLHKRCTDPFDEPRIERLLTEMKADEFIIIGATAEDAVKAMVLGLLQRGKKVRIVADAVGSRDKQEAKLALRKMEAKGAKIIETKKLAGSSGLHRVGICHCDACQRKDKKQRPPAAVQSGSLN